MSKRAFIQTFGCQMNEYDSNRMEEILKGEGYRTTEEMETAELILVNTCSVRENPENKVYSLIGRLNILKKKNPDLVVGVAGCVAQQEGETILKRSKAVDMVIGTDCLVQLPQMLKQVRAGKRVLATSWMPREKKIQNFIPEEEIRKGHVEGCKGMVAITKGCDNYCTFCIVPTTRGRLVSRELENVVEECRELIQKGAKEIQLLGQNVNSYQAHKNGFYELLKAVADLEGMQRIRFMSPHPNDWNNGLSDLMASHPVICKQLHLPFQAGSDRILKMMKRDHTAKEYLEKIDYLKKRAVDVTLGTDIIVGFPGETDKEFRETLNLLQEVRFSQVYAFKYSPRPGTKAVAMEDSIPREVKEARLAELFERQKSIEQEDMKSLLNREMDILIDSAHPRERHAMSGRTEGNLSVTIPFCEFEIGNMVSVKITDVRAFSLKGQLQ
ncbi:MAG: tRNA (N6-isopentenyl adenosine(37)-C2)-methylthiotransferase MiaB [Proteobacteria bacterium]|nr:tRNA (N6-isopentenyl adenosine(37)-C2)-methylthiotransferase MiaB [Pseudomonadota bacterium]